ncbi:hypothetical protein BDR03DRAFT_340747 [Suillus americanus]|nr:hypothetical protein BDR03DRAFT_340747 [Suillus americanus]
MQMPDGLKRLVVSIFPPSLALLFAIDPASAASSSRVSLTINSALTSPFDHNRHALPGVLSHIPSHWAPERYSS